MEADNDRISNLRGHLLASAGDASHRSYGARPQEKKSPDTAWWPTFLVLWIVLICTTGFAFTMRGLPLWFQAVMVAIIAAGAVLLLLTVQVDPGLVPPSPYKDPIVHALESNEDSIPLRDSYSRDWRGQWTRQGGGQGGTGQLQRYCGTCNVWREPRVSHCRVCQHCYERYDHHCFLLGTCIARRNHRFFAGFLIACQAGAMWLLAAASWRLHQIGFPGRESWRRNDTYALLILGVLYAHHVCLLLFGVGHCCSIICDVTTKDLLTSDASLKQPGASGLLPVAAGAAAQPPPPCNGWCPLLRRSPRQVLDAWRSVCCAPVQWRSSVALKQEEWIRQQLVQGQEGERVRRHGNMSV